MSAEAPPIGDQDEMVHSAGVAVHGFCAGGLTASTGIRPGCQGYTAAGLVQSLIKLGMKPVPFVSSFAGMRRTITRILLVGQWYIEEWVPL